MKFGYMGGLSQDDEYHGGNNLHLTTGSRTACPIS